MSINVQVATQIVEVNSRGRAVKVDLTKLSNDILANLLTHGLIQKVGDAASAAKKQAILDTFGDDFNQADAQKWSESEAGERAISDKAQAMMEKAVDALLEGRWAIREGTGTVSRWTPTQDKALEMARNDLLAKFKAAAQHKGIKATMANFIKLSPAVAKYFTEKAGKPVWDDKAVMAYIDAQASAGTIDYMAKAAKELDRLASMVADINVDDLLDGI